MPYLRIRSTLLMRSTVNGIKININSNAWDYWYEYTKDQTYLQIILSLVIIVHEWYNHPSKKVIFFRDDHARHDYDRDDGDDDAVLFVYH